MSARIPKLEKPAYRLIAPGAAAERSNQRDTMKLAAAYLQTYGSVTIVKVNHEAGK